MHRADVVGTRDAGGALIEGFVVHLESAIEVRCRDIAFLVILDVAVGYVVGRTLPQNLQGVLAILFLVERNIRVRVCCQSSICHRTRLS